MRFAKRVFQVAGIYGLIVLVPQFFLEAKTGRDFPPTINHPEYYYGFIGVAVAWQFVFLVLARNPQRYRPMMIPAILEKAGFGIAVVVLFLGNRVSSFMLGPALIDMILGVLFAISYLKTSGQPET